MAVNGFDTSSPRNVISSDITHVPIRQHFKAVRLGTLRARGCCPRPARHTAEKDAQMMNGYGMGFGWIWMIVILILVGLMIAALIKYLRK